HALVELAGGLDELAHVVMEAGAEAHVIGGGADGVEAIAHGLEAFGRDAFVAVGREDDEVTGAEVLEKGHGGFGGGDDGVAFGGVVRIAVEGVGDDAAAALFGFGAHLGGGDVVSGEDLGELSYAQADEAGVLHDIEDVC